jgi:RNA polymerase sigma factor (sigma-70 family)
MSSAPSDSELVARCRRNDEAAWEMLVKRYERLVYGVAVNYGLTPSERDDVFQKTWLALLNHLPRLQQPDRIAAWLVTTAKHNCWEMRRGAHYTRTVVTDPDVLSTLAEADNETPEEIVERFQQFRQVRNALSQLEARCRQLLQLLYFEKRAPSYSDIAEQTGMPIGAIGPNRARCLQKLRHFLAES